MPDNTEVTFVTVAGVDVDAALLVCQTCNVLDVSTTVDTTQVQWVATCTAGHVWRFVPTSLFDRTS